jgi:predicted Fe-Mo cluster-binding NifX family protein
VAQRVAIPVFNDEVSPRFGFAGRILVADVADGEVGQQRVLDVSGFGWRARLALLAHQGVTHLICGGFDRVYLPFLQGLGIRVSWGHAGAAADILERVCRGEIQPTTDRELFGPRRRARGGRRGGGRGGGRGNGGRCGGGAGIPGSPRARHRGRGKGRSK